MTLEIRSNGHIFIAGEKGSASPAAYEHKGLLKEAGFWWHGGPCKPGCKACEFKVPKMWWTADPVKAARLRDYCNPAALAHMAPIFAKLEQSRKVRSDFHVPCPDGLAYDPFQLAGVEFVIDAFKTFRGAMIADEMGLGKTVQALGVMNVMDNEDGLQCAVVCPKSLVLNWKREAQKWLNQGWTVLTYEEWLDGHDATGSNVLLIWSYSQVSKFPAALDGGALDLLVFDESQYIKNPDAQRTRECIDHVEQVNGKRQVVEGRIQSQARKTLFLTGTPILNRHIELQTFLIALDPSFQGFWFLKKFCDAKKDAQGHWTFAGSTNSAELQGILRTKFMVRRLKKDVYKDLPAKRRSLIPLELNSEAKAIIKAAGAEQKFEDAVTNMEGKKPWGHPAQVRQRLAIAKVGKVVEFVKDLLENTQKVIVFGFTIDSMKQIAQELRLVSPKVGLIIGDTDMEARQAYVRQFQEDPECRVIVGGYGPMGVGLTLTASSTVVMTEPAWTPAEVSQAEDRAHRRGQTEMVNCYHLVWDGTLEAKMMQMVIRKQDIADKVLDRPTEIKAGGAVQVSDLMMKHLDGTFDINNEPAREKARAMAQATAPAYLPEEKALIHRALRFLALRCDGAKEHDEQGFNGLDSAFGKSLAASSTLSDKQAYFGKKMIRKYRKQLEAGGISLDSLIGT